MNERRQTVQVVVRLTYSTGDPGPGPFEWAERLHVVTQTFVVPLPAVLSTVELSIGGQTHIVPLGEIALMNTPHQPESLG